MIYKFQDPIILTFLLVYVPNCKSLGAILAQSESLNKYLQMITGIIFTYVYVSIMACRNFVLFLCSLTLNSKLVDRCFGAGYFSLACIACTFICKQNDLSSLDELSLEFLYIELSCAENLPLVNWYALGDLYLFLYDSCSLWHKLLKCPIITVSALIFSSRAVESFYVFGISNL